jgi:hypothetical protein
MNRLRARSAAIWAQVVRPFAWLDAAPLRQQLTVGFGLYAVVLLALVATAINGTSSGQFYGFFFPGHDPRLLIGGPRAVRSDEWYVTTPLVISQVQQGFPRFSDIFPGGVDVSIMWDVPYREWSTLFRPQNWGFFFLPLDNAFASRWWLPLVALAAAAYALVVTLWRRPVAALALSAAFAFSPFTQWWFGSGTFWPLAFALVICASVVWCLRTERARLRWAIASIAGYVAVVAVLTLYPPFLVPCVIVAAAFSVGWVVAARELGWAERWRRLAPILVAGVVAGVVVLVFLATRTQTVEAITSTVYPGDRRWPTGQSSLFPWLSMYAGAFGVALRAGSVDGFAVNQSEGSSFLLVGFYLVPTAIWLLVSRWRAHRRVDWPIVALLAAAGVLAAYIYVPGWDAIAALLFLDRTTLPRVVVGVGLVAFLLLVVVVHRLLVRPDRVPVWLVGAATALALANHGAVALALHRRAPQVLEQFRWWPALVVILVVAVALYGAGRATLPSLLVLVVALVMVAGVIPLYRGVLDLRTTDLGQAIHDVESRAPGSWLALEDGNISATVRRGGLQRCAGVADSRDVGGDRSDGRIRQLVEPLCARQLDCGSAGARDRRALCRRPDAAVRLVLRVRAGPRRLRCDVTAARSTVRAGDRHRRRGESPLSHLRSGGVGPWREGPAGATGGCA